MLWSVFGHPSSFDSKACLTIWRSSIPWKTLGRSGQSKEWRLAPSLAWHQSQTQVPVGLGAQHRASGRGQRDFADWGMGQPADLCQLGRDEPKGGLRETMGGKLKMRRIWLVLGSGTGKREEEHMKVIPIP